MLSIAVAFWVATIVGSMCIFGAIPLFFEIVCESTFPVAEGVTNGFLIWVMSVVGLVFLLVVMIPIGECCYDTGYRAHSYLL